MILIVKNSHLVQSGLLTYLAENSPSVYVVSIEDMFNSIKVTDSIVNSRPSGALYLGDKKIDLDKVRAVYHEIYTFPIDVFLKFHPKDRDYARSEWLAYLVYRFSLYRKIINPFHPELYASPLFQIPVLFFHAKRYGLKTPNFLFSTDSSSIQAFIEEKPSILLDNLYCYKNYSQSKQLVPNVIGSIEKIVGACVYAHIIPGHVFASIWFKDSAYVFHLEKEIKEKILSFTKSINLNMAEICFFMNKAGELYFYYISPIIDWSRCMENKAVIWRKLLDWLNE